MFRDFVGFVLLVSVPAPPALSEQCASNKIQWLWSDPPQDVPAQFQVIQLTLEQAASKNTLLLAGFVPNLRLVYPVYEKHIEDRRIPSFSYAMHGLCAPPIP